VQEDSRQRATSQRVINIFLKLNNYNNYFTERENGVLFLKELIALHTLTAIKKDENKLQDLEFDRLMGRTDPVPIEQEINAA